jgi:large subunit ribosomal protein L10
MQKNILEKKENDVSELVEKFKKAASVVSFSYQGLSVDKFMKLRRQLREQKIECHVFKNNISRRAAAALGQEKFSESLVGVKALAISYGDAVAPAKIIFDLAKEFKQIKLSTGLVEGHYADEAGIAQLATLPSREVLLAQLAFGLLGPVYQLSFSLGSIEK